MLILQQQLQSSLCRNKDINIKKRDFHGSQLDMNVENKMVTVQPVAMTTTPLIAVVSIHFTKCGLLDSKQRNTRLP